MLESEIYEVYKDQGFEVLQLLAETNVQGQMITPAFIDSWIAEYGLTYPVLQDKNWFTYSKYTPDNYIPLNMILDKCLKIDYKASGFNEAVVKSHIEALLAQ